MPLMMGITESTGDVQSNRQYEIFAAGIKSVQHYAERMLERLLGLALEAQGIPAVVEFRFAELRSSEMLRDAQTEAMRIANAKAKRDEGWISQDEASTEITGSPAVSPAPLVQAAPEAVDGGNVDGLESMDQPADRGSTSSPTFATEDRPAEPVEAWLAELREGKALVSEALDAIRSNGYHAPH